MSYILLLIFSSIFSVNTDLKEIANEFDAEYIEHNTIIIGDDKIALICIPNSEKETLSRAILLQSFQAKLASLKNDAKEMVVFNNMILVRKRKQLILFKLSDYKVSSDLKEKLGDFTSVDLYGFGRKYFKKDREILFNEGAVSNALNSYFSASSEEQGNGECGCNGYTVSCSCSGGGETCSVGCSSAAYACCTRPPADAPDPTPTCKCIGIKEVQGN